MPQNKPFQKGDKKVINAWTMYDWANSVYSLVITSAIFPLYYDSVTTQKDAAGNIINDKVNFFGFEFINSELFSYSISISFLLVAALSPLLSSIADYSGSKKAFMRFFCYMGALACMTMYFFTDLTNVEIGILSFMFAAIGYSGSIVFYNAYLPIIAEPKDHDNISAAGFAKGYIGSVLLLLFCLAMIMKPATFGIPDTTVATRLSFVLVGIWWIVFSFIPFHYLPRNVFGKKPEGHFLLNGYKELAKVWQELSKLPALKTFLAAFFFLAMGVQTILYLAALFGSKELQLEANFLIYTILTIQLVAIVGAYGFAFLSGKIGNVKTLMIAMVLWMSVCVIGYYVADKWAFLGLAGLVGMVMGGTQALARSTYAKLLPATQSHASYFSFFDVAEKTAIVIGTFVFGFLNGLTGSMRSSILPLATFFFISLILLSLIRKHKIVQKD